MKLLLKECNIYQVSTNHDSKKKKKQTCISESLGTLVKKYSLQNREEMQWPEIL